MGDGLSCRRTRALLLKRCGTVATRCNFFEFEIGVANLEDAKAIQKDFTFSDDVDILAIREEGPAAMAAVKELPAWDRADRISGDAGFHAEVE